MAGTTFTVTSQSASLSRCCHSRHFCCICCSSVSSGGEHFCCVCCSSAMSWWCNCLGSVIVSEHNSALVFPQRLVQSTLARLCRTFGKALKLLHYFLCLLICLCTFLHDLPSDLP